MEQSVVKGKQEEKGNILRKGLLYVRTCLHCGLKFQITSWNVFPKFLPRESLLCCCCSNRLNHFVWLMCFENSVGCYGNLTACDKEHVSFPWAVAGLPAEFRSLLSVLQASLTDRWPVLVLCFPLQRSSVGWLRTGWVTWNLLLEPCKVKGESLDRANIRPETMAMVSPRLNTAARMEVRGKAAWKEHLLGRQFRVSPTAEPWCENQQTWALSLVPVLPPSVTLDKVPNVTSFLMSLSLIFF